VGAPAVEDAAGGREGAVLAPRKSPLSTALRAGFLAQSAKNGAAGFGPLLRGGTQATELVCLDVCGEQSPSDISGGEKDYER